MARNKIATIGAGAAGRKIAPRMGPGPSGQNFSGADSHGLTRRPFDIRIDDRAKPLALVQGSGFRRAVDIKADDTVQAGFSSQPHAAHPLIAVFKQLVG